MPAATTINRPNTAPQRPQLAAVPLRPLLTATAGQHTFAAAAAALPLRPLLSTAAPLRPLLTAAVSVGHSFPARPTLVTPQVPVPRT